jgi:ankyrin repeat protein
LLKVDWKTALTVILHSSYYTKRVHEMRGLPLDVAFRRGAPIEVVTALLEAYPDATTIRNKRKHLPCHSACRYGTSSEAMRMLLRCNPNVADVMNGSRHRGRTPMQIFNNCEWKFFVDEKEQVGKDLKQHARAQSSRLCSGALSGRLIGGVLCSDQWQG